jgi:hypothetical protein
MMVDFFGLFSVDTLYIVLGLAGATLISLIISIVAVCKAAGLKKRYKVFMAGDDGKSVEKLVREHLDSIEEMQKNVLQNGNAINDIYDKLQYTFQKVGIVKYDAFHEMGGKLSFALCILDKKDNGCVVNVMHSNNGCFAYIKEIVNGESYIELGDEEKKAVDEAVAGKMGDVDLSKKVNDMIQK